MTVEELIKKLQEYDDNLEIRLDEYSSHFSSYNSYTIETFIDGEVLYIRQIWN